MRSHDLRVRNGRPRLLRAALVLSLAAIVSTVANDCARAESTFPPSRFKFSFLMEPGASPT